MSERACRNTTRGEDVGEQDYGPKHGHVRLTPTLSSRGERMRASGLLERAVMPAECHPNLGDPRLL